MTTTLFLQIKLLYGDYILAVKRLIARMQPNLEENKVFIHEFSRTAPVNVLLDHFFLMNEWPTWRTFRGKVLRKCRMFFLVVISSLKA